MSDPTVADLLNMKGSEAKRIPPIPVGHYLLSIIGYTFGEQKNENKTPFCQLQYGVNSPCADVDMEELDAIGGDEVLKKKKLMCKWWTTPDAIVMIVEHLKLTGLPDDVSIKEMIQASKGQEIVGYVDIQEGENGKYNVLTGKFISVEDMDSIG